MAALSLDISDKPYGWVAVCLIDQAVTGNKLTVDADQQYAIANDHASQTVSMKVHRKGDAEFTSYADNAGSVDVTADGEANLPVGRAIVIGPGIDYIFFDASGATTTVTVSAGTKLFGYY